jgi:hypothetical protein
MVSNFVRLIHIFETNLSLSQIVYGYNIDTIHKTIAISDMLKSEELLFTRCQAAFV